MSFLKEIRKKPEEERRKILWISVFLIGIILTIFLFLNLKYNFPGIDFTNFRGPAVNKEDFEEAKEGIDNFQDNVKKKTEEMEKSSEEK